MIAVHSSGHRLELAYKESTKNVTVVQTTAPGTLGN